MKRKPALCPRSDADRFVRPKRAESPADFPSNALHDTLYQRALARTFSSTFSTSLTVAGEADPWKSLCGKTPSHWQPCASIVAPNYLADFYSSPLDWSSRGIVALVMNAKVGLLTEAQLVRDFPSFSVTPHIGNLSRVLSVAGAGKPKGSFGRSTGGLQFCPNGGAILSRRTLPRRRLLLRGILPSRRGNPKGAQRDETSRGFGDLDRLERRRSGYDGRSRLEVHHPRFPLPFRLLRVDSASARRHRLRARLESRGSPLGDGRERRLAPGARRPTIDRVSSPQAHRRRSSASMVSLEAKLSRLRRRRRGRDPPVLGL